MNDAFSRLLKGAVDAQVDAESSAVMTLGEMSAALAPLNGSLPVLFSDGRQPGKFHSWRGVYRHVAISPDGAGMTVGELREAVSETIGETFTGYKGGDFTMTRQTPVWVAHYGAAGNTALVGVREEDGGIVLDVSAVEGW